MLTPKTANSLLSKNKVSNNYAASFIRDDVAKWDDHKEDGKYIIGYTISDYMDALNKKLIPEVNPKHATYEYVMEGSRSSRSFNHWGHPIWGSCRGRKP